MRILLTIGVIIALGLTAAESLRAQSPGARGKLDRKTGETKPAKKAPNTMINMELLTVGDGVGLKARQWQEILSKMDVTLTIRNGRPSEKPEVTERKAGGTLRTVMLKGLLDNKGRLIFPDQVFAESDSAKLAAWLDELRTYGAQGDPVGRPAWGLTKEQFGVIYAALKKPLAFDPRDLELSKALQKFEFPREYPLKFTASAARLLNERTPISQSGHSLQGISQGTGLAILLREQGLGFRPRRLPDGTVELTVSPLDEPGEVWPVGWPRQESGPETAPALFEFKTVDLEDERLDDILEAASDQIGIPIVIDRHGMDAKGIDLAQVKISHPRKRTTWITALNTFTFKAKCKFEVLIDEAGKPFVWVTPLATPARKEKE
jgi:hypothetical protein